MDRDIRSYFDIDSFLIRIKDTFFGVHFNWRISLVGLKMRMSIMTAIYRKCLTVRFVDSNAPEMLNLMSTDTDRLVNSCISFHSFWSIPFQVSASLHAQMARFFPPIQWFAKFLIAK